MAAFNFNAVIMHHEELNSLRYVGFCLSLGGAAVEVSFLMSTSVRILSEERTTGPSLLLTVDKEYDESSKAER